MSFIAAHSIAERKAIVKSLQPYYSIELLTVFARQFDTTHSVTPAAREEVCVCWIVCLYRHLSGSCFRGANAVRFFSNQPNQSSQPAPSSNAHMSHECSPDDVVETGSHCAEQSADDMVWCMAMSVSVGASSLKSNDSGGTAVKLVACPQQEEDELDEDEFFVDRIVNHKGKGSGLKFLVKWKVRMHGRPRGLSGTILGQDDRDDIMTHCAALPASSQGYPDEDNTWEPLANVEENEKLYEYLEDHPELKDALTKSRAKAGRR
jgi:hypothetical protein